MTEKKVYINAGIQGERTVTEYDVNRRLISNASCITSFWDLLEKKGIHKGMCE